MIKVFKLKLQFEIYLQNYLIHSKIEVVYTNLKLFLFTLIHAKIYLLKDMKINLKFTNIHVLNSFSNTFTTISTLN